MKVLDRYLSVGELTAREQSMEDAETYFIIHPVLKHIAMLGIQNRQNMIKGLESDGYEDGNIYTAGRDC